VIVAYFFGATLYIYIYIYTAAAECCADPYVKVALLYNGQCIGKKKTQVRKKTLNPTFNESFMFDLPPACNTPVPGPPLSAYLFIFFSFLG